MPRKNPNIIPKIIDKADISTPGVYRFIEKGIIYDLNYLEFTNLKLSGKKTVAEWHSMLNKFMQGAIKKTEQSPVVSIKSRVLSRSKTV